VRRRMEVVRDVVIVLTSEALPGEIFGLLSELPGVSEFAGQDERRVTLRFAGGSAAQVIVTTPVNLGAVLLHATGSEAHLRQLSAHAASLGYALSGAALWRGSEFVPTPDEATLYAALGLQLVPPELREGRDEIALAARGALPRLLERDDLLGFLHCHTNYSDGTNTVEQLAIACREQGYRYVGITDHSQSAADSGGLQAADLERQWGEIDAVNARLDGVHVLKGVEADILQDGALDYPAPVLERLDFVIGSVHSRFNMNAEQMTARVLCALDDPRLTILGHPTGRLLLSRDPYQLDMDAVIERAAARGVALEINADPHRLDLDWRVLPAVKAAGAPLSIGADAHNIAGIGYADFGVGIARKGGLGPDDVLNARDLDGFLAFASKGRD